MKNINTIIWDWNGTLLNDIEICVDSINILLKQRNHKTLSIEKYHKIFTFPVKDYYTRAGFNFEKEPFDEVAIEFIDIYREKIPKATLFSDVEQTLNFFKKRGFKQIIISAMEKNFLLQSVEQKKIEAYFEVIAGINNHHAVSKLDLAKEIIINRNINPNKCVLIGDTLHDFEVAENISCKCILVASGHQSLKKLSKANCRVVSNLNQVKCLFKNF
ncbi:MAG: HAD family hydrolase [Bacteroidales bacterium]|nr:HAD family hydrolase [Bacteroidales bacterium]